MVAVAVRHVALDVLVEVAHLRAAEAGKVIDWWQAGAEKLPFEDGSVDVLASHWLLHEMPPWAIRNYFKEARRVLRPGGVFMAQDIYLAPGGAIGQWLSAGYAARNNEPFVYTLANMDLRKEMADAGLEPREVALSYPKPSEAVANGDLPPARTLYVSMVTAVSPSQTRSI